MNYAKNHKWIYIKLWPGQRQKKVILDTTIFSKFDKIKGMKAVCTANKGPVQKKWRCNLKCANGNENVWSIRPIKCKVKNHPEMNKYDDQKDTTYKWKPSQIKNADSLCDEKEECGNIRDQYNVSNKLLSWTKTQVTDRQTLFEFR